MSRVFTRQEFHALVWSKPMTHLAKEFALSDVALHKIRRKHDVPNPALGWWAKKAAGKPVKQTPLPRAKAGISDRITIAAGEMRPEPDLIATARENARVLASSIVVGAAPPTNPIVDRTITQLRKAKPSATNGLVAVEGAGVVNVSVAPASIDRAELMLLQIAAAAGTLGIKLVRGDKNAAFICEGETIGFQITETVKREKHVPTEKEIAEQEAARRKRERRWKSPDRWDDADFSFSFLRGPEWDYHPTGQLAFELEQSYSSARARAAPSRTRRCSASRTWRATSQSALRSTLLQRRTTGRGAKRRRESARTSGSGARSRSANAT